MTNLTGQTVVVTGAAHGIGFALAQAAAELGASVWLLDIDSKVDEVTETLRSSGVKARSLKVDVSDSQLVEEAFSHVVASDGGIDGLVNDAAIQEECSLLDIDDATWKRQLAVTLSGTFFCTRAAARSMLARGQGRIVNISSIAAERGSSRACHYGAAKAGVLGLTRSLARELGRAGIAVNAVAPGFVMTEMTKERAELRGASYLEQIPLGYFAEPRDLIGVVLLLLSDAGRYINGETIHVNGGWYIC